MIKYLLGKALTGKMRYAVVECDEEWHEPEHGYIIQRSYGQVQGKNTLSPAIIVDKTKQKRNWKEQYTLQFNSEVKKFLDKGYVEIDKHPNEYSSAELEAIFGDVKIVCDTSFPTLPLFVTLLGYETLIESPSIASVYPFLVASLTRI